MGQKGQSASDVGHTEPQSCLKSPCYHPIVVTILNASYPHLTQGVVLRNNREMPGRSLMSLSEEQECILVSKLVYKFGHPGL